MKYVEFIQKLKAAIFDYTQELRRENPLNDGIATKMANVRFTRYVPIYKQIEGGKWWEQEIVEYVEETLGENNLDFSNPDATESYINLIEEFQDKDMESLFFNAGRSLLFDYILKDEVTGEIDKNGHPEHTETYWREYNKWKIYQMGYWLHRRLSMGNSAKKENEVLIFPEITDQVKMFADEIDVPYDSETKKMMGRDGYFEVKRPLNREALLHDIYTLCCSWEDISSTDICKRWYQLYCVLVEKGFIAEKKQNKWKEFVQKVVGYCIKFDEQQVGQLASKLRDYYRNIGNRVETDVETNIMSLIEQSQDRANREFISKVHSRK